LDVPGVITFASNLFEKRDCFDVQDIALRTKRQRRKTDPSEVPKVINGVNVAITHHDYSNNANMFLFPILYDSSQKIALKHRY
jgi:hypothetical protein